MGICMQRGADIDPNWQCLPGYATPNQVELTSVSGSLDSFQGDNTGNSILKNYISYFISTKTNISLYLSYFFF